MKATKLLFLITLFTTVFFTSCSEERELELNPDQQTYFFLKNAEGVLVKNIAPEFRIPIHDHLLSLGRKQDAKNFLLTYKEDGNLASEQASRKRVVLDKAIAERRVLNVGYHLQNIGWRYFNSSLVGEGQFYDFEFGTTGQSRRLEAFFISLQGVNICYESHLANIGWQGVRCNGNVSGTTGQSRRMEAIKINIKDGKGIVFYKSHLQNIGWESRWKTLNQVSGTTGQSRRLEAIRIKFYMY